MSNLQQPRQDFRWLDYVENALDWPIGTIRATKPASLSRFSSNPRSQGPPLASCYQARTVHSQRALARNPAGGGAYAPSPQGKTESFIRYAKPPYALVRAESTPLASEPMLLPNTR